MSQHLENMKIGDSIDFKGPSGRLVYKGHGKFSIKILRKDPPVDYDVKKVRTSIRAFVNVFHIYTEI